MNFYAFHIGDYAAATRHLSWDEDMAYRRMLDVYYAREQPLPADVKAIYRLTAATTPKQRQAVDTVLAEFFTKTDDGYRNARCEEEIDIAAEKAIDRDEKKDNEKERQRRHRARRRELFEALRAYGVVPPFDTATKTLEEMVTRRDGHEAVTRDDTQTQRLTNPNPNPNPNPNIALASDSARATGDPSEAGNPISDHSQACIDLLDNRAADLTEWENDFLISIKWAERLTRGQAEKLKGIQDRLSAKSGTPNILPSVKRGTAAFEAWLAYWRKQGRPTGFAETLEVLTVPTEFPPSEAAA